MLLSDSLMEAKYILLDFFGSILVSEYEVMSGVVNDAFGA